jgi:hypothetical protein
MTCEMLFWTAPWCGRPCAVRVGMTRTIANTVSLGDHSPGSRGCNLGDVPRLSHPHTGLPDRTAIPSASKALQFWSGNVWLERHGAATTISTTADAWEVARHPVAVPTTTPAGSVTGEEVGAPPSLIALTFARQRASRGHSGQALFSARPPKPPGDRAVKACGCRGGRGRCPQNLRAGGLSSGLSSRRAGDRATERPGRASFRAVHQMVGAGGAAVPKTCGLAGPSAAGS